MLYSFIYVWPTGGTYFSRAFLEESIPDSINNEDEDYYGAVVSTSEVLINSLRYIYPIVYKNTAIIDGNLDGNISIKAYNVTASETAHLTQINLEFFLKDDQDVDTLITMYNIDISDISFPEYPGVTYAFPFTIPIDNLRIRYNQRLVVRVYLYGYSSDGSYCNYNVMCTKNSDDFYISVPFI